MIRLCKKEDFKTILYTFVLNPLFTPTEDKVWFFWMSIRKEGAVDRNHKLGHVLCKNVDSHGSRVSMIDCGLGLERPCMEFRPFGICLGWGWNNQDQVDFYFVGLRRERMNRHVNISLERGSCNSCKPMTSQKPESIILFSKTQSKGSEITKWYELK